jgi:hypothetical protein
MTYTLLSCIYENKNLYVYMCDPLKLLYKQIPYQKQEKKYGNMR